MERMAVRPVTPQSVGVHFVSQKRANSRAQPMSRWPEGKAKGSKRTGKDRWVERGSRRVPAGERKDWNLPARELRGFEKTHRPAQRIADPLPHGWGSHAISTVTNCWFWAWTLVVALGAPVTSSGTPLPSPRSIDKG